MTATEKFFDKKRAWSVFKDKVLSDYISPYLNKIAYTRKPTIFIDCFAGQGKFGDGEKGSPLIILEKVNEYKAKNPHIQINEVFIENEYGDELEKNVNDSNVVIWKDSYENKVNDICNAISGRNVFLYIDPYGIKSLDFESFRSIKSCNHNSLEMLLNFNSFGFLREGCRLLKYEDEKLFADAVDTEYLYERDVNDIARMDKIANGDYWQKILKKYKDSEIDMFHAEELFAKAYVEKVAELFNYVLHIPIKLKVGNIPKYRLIFGTNRDDGAFLMVDKMNEIWSTILLDERKGQYVMFDEVKPDSSIKEIEFEPDFLSEIEKRNDFVNVREIIGVMMRKYGIAYGTKKYKEVLKKLENDKILIKRTPATTEKTKKPTSFFSFENNENKMEVKKK